MPEVQEPVLESAKEEIKKQRHREAKKRERLLHPERVRERKRQSRLRHPEQHRERNRRYRERNREKICERNRKVYAQNPRKALDYYKQWMLSHHDQYREIQRKADRRYRAKNLEKCRAYANNKHRELRQETISAYGGLCKCCGESTLQFLAIDHVHNGKGNPAKRTRTGMTFYRWLKKQAYPSGFQVLCHNCNLAKAFYGSCPHSRQIIPPSPSGLRTDTA